MTCLSMQHGDMGADFRPFLAFPSSRLGRLRNVCQGH